MFTHRRKKIVLFSNSIFVFQNVFKSPLKSSEARAENFRMVDFENNALTPGFTKPKMNTHSIFKKRSLKFNQSAW